jgi:hypothetical protein
MPSTKEAPRQAAGTYFELMRNATSEQLLRNLDLGEIQGARFQHLLRLAHDEGLLLGLISEAGLDQSVFSPKYRATQWLRRGLNGLRIAIARCVCSALSRLFP